MIGRRTSPSPFEMLALRILCSRPLPLRLLRVKAEAGTQLHRGDERPLINSQLAIHPTAATWGEADAALSWIYSLRRRKLRLRDFLEMLLRRAIGAGREVLARELLASKGR